MSILVICKNLSIFPSGVVYLIQKMRISNTNYKNISYDKARGRYRIEMRIGKLPRTARVKDLQSAILIRDEWLIERNHLNAELAAEKIKLNQPEFEIIKKETIIYFD